MKFKKGDIVRPAGERSYRVVSVVAKNKLYTVNSVREDGSFYLHQFEDVCFYEHEFDLVRNHIDFCVGDIVEIYPECDSSYRDYTGKSTFTINKIQYGRIYTPDGYITYPAYLKLIKRKLDWTKPIRLVDDASCNISYVGLDQNNKRVISFVDNVRTDYFNVDEYGRHLTNPKRCVINRQFIKKEGYARINPTNIYNTVEEAVKAFPDMKYSQIKTIKAEYEDWE